MVTTKIIEGTIESLERRTNSTNGNPRFKITVDPGGSEPLVVLATETDGSVNYTVDNFTHRRFKGERLRFVTNGNGRVIDITFQDGSRA